MATLTDREYDSELHKLHDQLLLMGAKVEEMIANSMRALTERDSELARRMIEFDHQINRLEVDTDELCLRILAKRQPVASPVSFPPPFPIFQVEAAYGREAAPCAVLVRGGMRCRRRVSPSSIPHSRSRG